MKKKNTIITLIMLLLALILFLPNFSKIINDVLDGNISMSLVNGDYIKNNIFSSETYKMYFKNFTNPINGIGIIFMLWVTITSISKLFNEDNDKFRQMDGYGSHGTARWHSKSEIKAKYYKDDIGWFLGSTDRNKVYKRGMDAAYISVNAKLNMQNVVIGPPGSNKTTGFVLPNIYHLPLAYKKRNELIEKELEKREKFKNNHNDTFNRIYEKVNKKKYETLNKLKKEMPDLVITDPKSELWALTSEDLENIGYEVLVLDYIHLKYGDSLNSLSFITEDKELMEIAQNYVDSVEAKGAGGDQAFWNSQEAQY